MKRQEALQTGAIMNFDDNGLINIDIDILSPAGNVFSILSIYNQITGRLKYKSSNTQTIENLFLRFNNLSMSYDDILVYISKQLEQYGITVTYRRGEEICQLHAT
jgi:hypothetical protein